QSSCCGSRSRTHPSKIAKGGAASGRLRAKRWACPPSPQLDLDPSQYEGFALLKFSSLHDAAHSPAPARARREHSIESCSTPTDRVRAPVRVSPGCDGCISTSRFSWLRSGPRNRRSDVAKRGQLPERPATICFDSG